MTETDTGVALAPLVKQITVHLPPMRAFELFTDGLARWWPLATHSCAGLAARDVRFEPFVGGLVIEHAEDGSTAPWGTVLAWEPPHRFAMSWHPGAAPERATRLEVRFEATGDDECHVHLRHSGWEARGDDAIRVRGSYDGGWNRVLGRFAAFVAEGV